MNTNTSQSSYSVHQVALDLLLAGCVSKGLKPADLLEKIGEQRNFFSIEGNRLPSRKLGKLLRLASITLNDETLGFLQRPTKLGGTELALTSAMSATTLKQAIQNLGRFCSLVHDDMNLILTESEQEAKLSLHLSPMQSSTPVAQKPAIFVMMVLLFLVRWMSWSVNRQVMLNHVTMQAPEPVFAEDVDTIFPCQHSFHHIENALIFSRDYLDLPLEHKAEDVPAFVKTLPDFVTTRFVDSNLTGQIKRMLKKRDNIESLPLKVIAEELNKSPQTIRRHLKQEGITFAEIKENVRRDIAIYHLKQQETPIKNIAYLVGFSEPSAFIRAFKNWTGLTPGEFREKSRASE
ncbi:AraC family transcriptional regulator ligand-binding domain-containing protein [Paraneptunicella aestuarii]|uniref:AraC family transcriptional regulator n=1 Tax=Paraneptunicella aestuarii TaxID=2831148 RepID=UPI001E2BE579|nr:AraC family transcriptional regulator [Paraneptunicella aestuarii]UAA37713.1 AraC family transcriptional regulator ligand-binding domain-containing protein [Paraneptunicella aestuarii]